jgi:large conductance mechanosensitive channel
MAFFKEFRDFAIKGNVIDLAVGVIIGAALGAIVSSLVDDVVTPLLLNPALKAANADNIESLHWGAVKYGKFLAAVIKFLLVAFILFLLVKAVNKAKAKEVPAEAPPPAPTTSEVLLAEIRDALKK